MKEFHYVLPDLPENRTPVIKKPHDAKIKIVQNHEGSIDITGNSSGLGPVR